MYPPPSNKVTKSLLGRILEEVSHGKFTVSLVFEGGNRLTVMAPFRFYAPTKLNDAPIRDFPLISSDLVRALGEKVEKVSCASDGTLEVIFSNDDTLIVYANDPAYEAYTLSVNGEDFIV